MKYFIGSPNGSGIEAETFDDFVEYLRDMAMMSFHTETLLRQRKALSTMGIPFRYDMLSLFLYDYRW